MQHRMREWTMEPADVRAFLARAQVGRVSTVGADGYPYTVAVHFVCLNEKFYFHGLTVGEKLDNIARCGKVCFEADELTAVLTGGVDTPCDADAAYRSVVVRGDARVLTDPAEKRAVLSAVVEKYFPAGRALPMEDRQVDGTAVVEITPVRVTGKYHA